MNSKGERDEVATLGLLETINQQSDLSQRHLASKLGVALGLANSYLKRCVRKGWVKVRAVPANRYLYFITPKGFAEKSRLTAKYLSNSLAFYRKAGDSCLKQYLICQQHGWRRVLLCGLSDLSEIAVLRALETDIEIIGVYSKDKAGGKFFGKPVWGEFGEIIPYDACLLADLITPLQTYQELLDLVDKDKILVPEILGLELDSAAALR